MRHEITDVGVKSCVLSLTESSAVNVFEFLYTVVMAKIIHDDYVNASAMENLKIQIHVYVFPHIMSILSSQQVV